MSELLDWFPNIHLNATAGLIAAVALAVIYFLLNRQPKRTREAQDRFNELRDERAHQYRNLRPPN